MMNLDTYRIFLYAARTGSLTKAAEALYMTQPSVTYAIKQLEKSHGVKLFQRLSKGVRLSEEGTALLRYVEQSFLSLEEGRRKLDGLKRLEEGEIRIAANESLIKHFLLPQLNDFHNRYPEIRIRLSHGGTKEIVQRLSEGAADIGILRTPISEASTSLTIRPLLDIQDCFVAAPSYREKLAAPLTIDELLRLPVLLLQSGSSTRQFVEHWLALHGCSVTPDIELASLDLLIEFAKMGVGTAFITRSFVADLLEAGQLIELPLAVPIPARKISLALSQDRPLTAAARRFVELLDPVTEP